MLWSRAGLKVIATIDYPLQEKAEQIAAKYAKEKQGKIQRIQQQHRGDRSENRSNSGDGWLQDYFNQEDQGNFNVALPTRQPGSAIKPFVYAAAFEKGYSPNTVVFDVRTEFNPSCLDKYATQHTRLQFIQLIVWWKDECYMPENYDHNYRGPVILRDALAPISKCPVRNNALLGRHPPILLI